MKAWLWDTTGKLLSELSGHSGDIISLVFSPDGKRVATALFPDNTARLWDNTGNLLTELRGELASNVTSVVFSPDSKLVATAENNTARLWDTAGSLLAELRGHSASVNSVMFSPDSKRLATLSRDMCCFRQDGLKTFVMSRFENLLHKSQKRCYSQRKIKPFQVMLQVFSLISAQYIPYRRRFYQLQ